VARAPILEKPKDKHQPPRKVYPRQGTPQGGVISALLANLYLHWMDKRFHGKDGPAHVEDWLGLEINRTKTKVVKLTETGASLDFLGYSLRFEPDKYGRPKRFLNRVPSAGACSRERDKIRGMINKQRCFMPVPELIVDLNSQLSGWKNDDQHGRSRPALRAINRLVHQRLVRHLKRRSQRPYRPPAGVSWYSPIYKQLDLVRL